MFFESRPAVLEDVLTRARKTDFYRSRLSTAAVERWSDIPLTTKDDLRAAYPFGLLGVPRHEVATYHESSGTSGKPVASFFTENDWMDVQTRFLRSRMNLNERDLVLVKTPYSLVTTALQMHGAARRAGATVIAADNRSRNMPYARVIRLLHELPVTVAWCLPTEALIWAYLIKHRGLDAAKDFPHLRAIVVAGEPLSESKRAALSRRFGGKQIIVDYGSTETGSLAGECEFGNLHVWGDRIHCEVCDENGCPTSEEGALIVTPLFRRAMPLVRYNMEDRVRLSHDCACESVFSRIEVLGRQATRIKDRVFPKQIEDLIYSHGGDVWFWRARTKGEEMEIEVYGEGVSELRLESELRDRLQLTARVKSVPASAFESPGWFVEESAMQKPRFVFSEGEDWEKPLAYC